jgi:PAS domain S-box-containing protein
MISASTTPPAAGPQLGTAALRRVFDALPDTAVLVLAPDAPRFTILDATADYLAATLKRREDLLARPLFEAMHEANPHNPAPTGIQNLRASLEQVLRSGQPHRMPLQRYDVTAGDGTWQERYWAPHNVPVRGAHGSIEAIVHHVREVTAEVLSQQAARRAEQASARTLARMADAYALLDHAFRFVAVNAAAERLLGMSADALLGRSHWEVFPETMDTAVGRAYRRAVAERQEQHLTHSHGGRHVEVDAYPAEDGALAVFWRDVTQRVQAEQELREASRRKDVFIATLAHELRNPLAPIRTGMHILRLAPPGSPKATRALDVMERQLAHTVRLLDDLLDVSRISSGKLTLRLERVALDDLLEQAAEASRPFVDAGGHTLVHDVQVAGAAVQADRTRLLQVVGNLLNNAAKYTPPGGTIRLSARTAPGHATIAVEDNGVGIPPAQLEAIFGLFTQLPAGEYAQNGLGIGLSLSRTLVEMHGGTLTAESAGPGSGARFTVRLPLPEGETAGVAR